MDKVRFKINGADYEVGCEVSSDVTLLDFIRNYAEYRGTKYMCREAGCGACIVSAVKVPGTAPVAVNSCIVSILSCQEWEITTVEKVGNKLDGYSAIQTTLAEFNGTQCGHCTPGWVMSMYSLMHSRKDLTMLEIEQSFGSNTCRCTGYRPILEAFKKFAKDAPTPSLLPDIEDLNICKKSGKVCERKDLCNDEDWCVILEEEFKQQHVPEIYLKDGKKWYRASFIVDIFAVLFTEGDDSYMMVAGNTAKGAYPIEEYPRVLIDISNVFELKGFYIDQNLVIRAGTTITDTMETFKKLSELDYFEYLKKFYDHLQLVAHIPVRNLGTLAGNLMIKHQHNEFPSDIFLLFETVGAQLTILSAHGLKQNVTMQQFLQISMRGKIILNILLPPLNHQTRIVTYKIMPRSQNAHAVVNAGFLYKLSLNNTVLAARIVYGGLSPKIVRATATEKALLSKNLFQNEILQFGIRCLDSELIVVENPPEPSAAYRKQLAINLFYKGLLSLCPKALLGDRYNTAPIRLPESRPVSEARQIFETNPALWPLTKPVQKVEALIQCSGEAPYSEDLPSFAREVFACFVLSTVPTGIIVNINPSRALKQQGVIAFYSANDIPGLNSFIPEEAVLFNKNEEILSSGEIKYFNQPIGIIVAESRAQAERVSKMVEVQYSNIRRPVIDIKEAIKDPKRNTLLVSIGAQDKGTDIVKVFKGNNTIYGQYHMSMETLVCVTKPTEDGLMVYPATQWIDGVQIMTGRALKMDQNHIDVYVRRLGGAYGIKISRANQVAIACNLVAVKLNRPCRFINSLTTNMRAVGKRFPCNSEFEVAVDKKGEIQHLSYTIYEDNGYDVTEKLSEFGILLHNNCYNNLRWIYNCYNTITDTAKNTWCRAPGTLESIAMAEYLMEQISYELSLDPIDVRFANLDTKYDKLRDMVDELKSKSDYEKRRADVDRFNKENRWKKRGLRFALLRWEPAGFQYFDINLSVYHGDGTVVITHSGIEMGQGVNTKAVQVAAYYLNIPIDKIKIKGNDTIINPNSSISGGSLTSQNVGIGIKRACDELLKRLEPVKKTLTDPSWEKLIQTAYGMGIDLQSHGFVNQSDIHIYPIFGVTLAEVEVDILTGEFQILRVDLLHDVGRSLSPEIDVGQVEGAFIMGLGYWTSEHLVYNQRTGEILTDRTWNYHVPLARDIPQDFRVYFLKNSYSNDVILGSKAVGEPPICMSIVVPFAIREAIAAARLESGISTTVWFPIGYAITTEAGISSCMACHKGGVCSAVDVMDKDDGDGYYNIYITSYDGPYTLENICMATATKKEDFKFHESS